MNVAATDTLNNKKIGKHPEKILKIKPYIYKCNCNGITYHSEKGDWKKFKAKLKAFKWNYLHY